MLLPSSKYCVYTWPVIIIIMVPIISISRIIMFVLDLYNYLCHPFGCVVECPSSHNYLYTDQLCSGKSNGRVFNLELYSHRRQKLTLLHLSTGLFRKEIFVALQNNCKVNK